MTAEELVGGLRERGHFVMRMRVPPETILPYIKADDPLFAWLREELGVPMIEYRRSSEVPFAYEARLHRARVEMPPELLTEDPAGLVAIRGRLVWEAAA